MTAPISAISEVSGTSGSSNISPVYEVVFGEFKPENATMQNSISSVEDIFKKMEQANMSQNPALAEMISKDKNYRDQVRMSQTIRQNMIDGMRDVFVKRTTEATGMFKTAWVTKIFSKSVQGLTQLTSAQ